MTPYRVFCIHHGNQFLTREQYSDQLSKPDVLWKCPACNESGDFDQEWYECYYMFYECRLAKEGRSLSFTCNRIDQPVITYTVGGAALNICGNCPILDVDVTLDNDDLLKLNHNEVVVLP